MCSEYRKENKITYWIKMSESQYIKTKFLHRPPEERLKAYPNRPIRILFPQQPYVQNSCKDRINIVVIKGIITKIWIG